MRGHGADARALYWHAVEQQRAGWYKVGARMIKQRFQKEGKIIYEAVRDGYNIDQIVREQRPEWKKVYTSLYVNIARDFGRVLEQGLKAWSPTMVKAGDEWMRLVLDYLQQTAGRKITGIEQTTLQLVRNALSEGTAVGESTDQLAKRVADTYDLFTPYRSERISRTEVLTASERGSYSYALGTGLNLEKDWMTTIDGRERPWHHDVDGQRKPIAEPFLVNSELLDHPGDTSHGASPDNVIQCRCAAGYQVAG